MVAPSRVAAVTGANKGIGLAIGNFSKASSSSGSCLLTLYTVRNLALQYPSSPFHSGPFLIYLTARSAERGAEAVKTLESDPALRKAKVLAQDGGDTTIKFKELDISNAMSIREFAESLHKDHPGGIDFVINNAGIAMQGFGKLNAVEPGRCLSNF